jgi:hemoglobin
MAPTAGNANESGSNLEDKAGGHSVGLPESRDKVTTIELKTADAPNPHFARIGGESEVRRLVDAFYRRMDSLPEAARIRAMHGADLDEIKSTLRLYLVEWLGGPKDYSARRGPPRLRARHAQFAIGPVERDAWMVCMRAALEEVVADAELRAELERAFLRTANAIVNRSG